MQVADWLRGLALEQYAPAFEQNHVRWELLAELTADDLKDLGVSSVGHRRQLLAAIAALRAGAGSEPAPLATAPEAERRQVTVMFCDLVGSTVLSTQLDPEDLREVIGGFQRRMAQIISQFEGFVARYLGDGVLAYFGYPHAHEDDAEQAVRAGLALIDVVGELQAPHRLQVRVGIASGVVVVGDLIGTGSAQEQAIVGETPNLAARLQALAEPNAVVIAEGTRRQIGNRFKVRDLGLQSLKGFAEPQRVWCVVAENRSLGQFEALRSGTTPLVGRDEELDLLLRRWAQAKTGKGRVVLISGEPGVGKSRLALALTERIATQQYIRLRFHCSPRHEDSALHPFIVQMERAARFARSDAPGVRLVKLQSLLAATALPLEAADKDSVNRAVALIAELHALPTPDSKPAPDDSPQRKKEKTFEVLLGQFERGSNQKPVLILFEDIHWIDPSSRELLDRMIERIANWRVLLLATFRPEFQPPWTGQPHVTVLTLARLDQHDAMAMVTDLAGDTTLPSHVVQEIAERADGVPLFVEELTKAVLDCGAVETATLSAVPHAGFSVPATLHASLMARLDRLGRAAKDAAQIGAAIGREFSYELLASIAHMLQPQLLKALDRLTNSGLLFVRGIPPQSTYIFKHALVQDAAYSTLLRSRRQQLHSRIVTSLEEQSPELVLAEPAILAQHSAEAGLAEKAIAYWLMAGRAATARSAMTEAVAQLRKGLGKLADLPEGPKRSQKELDLLIALTSALTATEGWSSDIVGATLARVHRLALQIDRPEDLVPLLYGQGAFHCARSEYRLALPIADQLEKIGKARNDSPAQLLGSSLRGFAHYYRGEFVAARTLLQRHVADPTHHSIRAERSSAPYPLMLTYLGLTLACLGYIDQARWRVNTALSAARGHAFTVAHVLALLSYIDLLTGSPELEVHTEELLTLSTDHGFPYYLGFATASRAFPMIGLGQAEKAIELLREGLAAMRATGTVVGTASILIVLAEVCSMLGRWSEGLNFLNETAQIIEATDERVSEAELHRVRGDLLRAAADLSAAEQAYHQALAVARRQHAKLWQLRAATHLARLWRDQGKRAAARDLLAPVYAWFTEGFGAPDLVKAKALIDQLE